MTSQKNSEPISKLIINQKPTLENICDETYALKRAANVTRMRCQKESAKALSPQLPPDLRRAVEVASEKGASSWLTALPLERHGFGLHKGAFRDALFVYGTIGTQPIYLLTASVDNRWASLTHYHV